MGQSKLAGLLLSLVIVSPCWAITNGGFETGDFPPWETLGSATVDDDVNGDLPPAEGNFQATLFVPRGFDEPDLEDFFDLDDGAIASVLFTNGGEPLVGSAIKQTFISDGPGTISFDWRMAVGHPTDVIEASSVSAQEIVALPFAALYVLNGEVKLITTADDAGLLSIPPIEVGGFEVAITDHATITDSIVAGENTIGFMIVTIEPEITPVQLNSELTGFLIVDDVQTDVIPEPITATLAMMSVGALTLATRRRRGAVTE